MPVPPPESVGPPAWRFPDLGPDDEELIGFGADLSPETLVHAYRHGIFPWPHEGVALPWFSPDPRALIEPRGLHVSRSLRSTMRRCGWETTVDEAFDEVVRCCAAVRSETEGTWITPEMRSAYERLNRLGWAHSVEVWDGDGELAGGIYGVAVGACFTGESMFHRRTDASKVALVDLCRRWWEAGGDLVDVQLPTPHLATMGAIEISRTDFLERLARARNRIVLLPDDRRSVSRLVAAPSSGRGPSIDGVGRA
jgi:leucyl/phenylalanyl-tRNA--protein transferase